MSLSLPPEILELDELLSPEDALDFFTSLVPSMELVPEFAELHRRRSFTMAHKTDQAMLERVQSKIAEFIEQGKGRTEIVHDIEDILDAAGVTPANPFYGENVFRTNYMSAMTDGITQEMQDPEFAEAFPWWRYDGIEDGREGADHRPHFGKYFLASIPFAEVRDSLVVDHVENGQPIIRRTREGEQGRPWSCRCVPVPISKWEVQDLQAGGARVEPWPARHAETFAEGEGKPCGDSHISADKQCRIGTTQGGSTESPTRDQLDRAGKIFKAFDVSTPLGTYADRQMRGGTIKSNGTFKEFSESTKASNLRKLVDELDKLKETDPEAFELARQWDLADRFGVKNYTDLPDDLTIYRGHDADEVMRPITNVTHKQEIAEKFGESGVVSTYEIPKKDVIFSLSNSVFNEGELIVRRGTLKKTNEVMSKNAVLAAKVASFTPGQNIQLKSGETGTLISHGIGSTMVVKLQDGSTNYAVQASEVNL